MSLEQEFNRIQKLKFSFAKSTEFSEKFAKNCGALSMYNDGYGLGIPDYLSSENKLRAVFNEVIKSGGIFLFNISGVDIKKSFTGFSDFAEPFSNNQITEWELFMILTNSDYIENCISHNGKVQFKQQILWNALV